jgi:hypothetical protein
MLSRALSSIPFQKKRCCVLTLVITVDVGRGVRSLWRRRRVLVLCAGRLTATAVVLGEPLPAAPLGVIELGKHMKPSQKVTSSKYKY